MGIIIFAVMMLLLVLVPTASYFIAREIQSPDKRFEKFMKARYKHCDIMWNTATTEKQLYETIQSGSVINHVKDCNYCKYVLWNEPRYLSKHREDVRQIEKGFIDGRSVSARRSSRLSSR